ncbi:MAG: formate dehydrogenase accessory sulfurtransferase FdhD, partial [Nitrososphaerota archaeon]|jgi:formate dehydrogenase accessory protein FdhD|nr:formate dehydrogenase accessory sulfurtransferase FdhD [Nitrososphaerota archaeon]
LFAEEILNCIDQIESVTSNEIENVCKVQFKTNINLDDRLENRRRGARIVPLIKSSASAYQHDNKLATVTSDLTVNAKTILDAICQINEKAEGFKKTGGLHDSGLFNADGTMIAFSEDVGRHNTVDKVIGESLLKQVNFTQCFMIITGRVPGDMIYKTTKAGIPIIASMTAVLNSGIYSAKKANATLVGFARENRINIYTHPNRITL